MALYLRGLLAGGGLCAGAALAETSPANPYDHGGGMRIGHLQSESAPVRARAAEALGYMRYAPAEPALRAVLADPDADVRRNAVLALAWCGRRAALGDLVARLDDDAWAVRQSAWVTLTNLTGMDFPFDSLATQEERTAQAVVWRAWVAALVPDTLPADVVTLLASDHHAEVARGARAAGALGGAEAVSHVRAAIRRWETMANEADAEAKWRVQAGLRALGRLGGPEALSVLTAFLQNPQWARYAADALGDLGGEQAAAALLAAFPDHARSERTAISRANERNQGPRTHSSDQPVTDARDRMLAVPYAMALSLSRIPFTDAENLARLRAIAPQLTAQIPADIDSIVVYEEEPYQQLIRHLLERADMRQLILDAAFAALGQPRIEAGDEGGSPPPGARSPVLRGQDAPHRLVADIAGWTDLYLIVDEVDDSRMDRANWAEARLIDAEGRAVFLDTLEPVSVHQQHDTLRINRSAAFDDLRIGGHRFQRGLHTHAFSVLHYKLDGRHHQFAAQVGVCASRAAGQGSVRFMVTPQPPLRKGLLGLARLLTDPAHASKLVVTLCRDPGDLSRLIALLDHPNHWVRINAAKTLMFIGAPEAAAAMGERLEASQPEAEFGYHPPNFSTAKGQDEFNDPSPRYREAFIAALGRLGATEYLPLLEKLLVDDRNALEIQHAAARALDELGTPGAMAMLRTAEAQHPYHTVRMVAREALWKRGIEPMARPAPPPPPTPPRVMAESIPAKATRFVFIKGDPVPYNPFQMDSWRQAYMTTDSGPTYRPGRNLYVLDISGDAPVVSPLTRFEDGYVADVEVSYDGEHVWFSRRAADSPWWHLHEIRSDGTGHRQLTSGPYHDVQPVELPSGRIAFSTSRLGMRDEYHGYLATGLATLHPDGGDVRLIGFNVGRDAEPAVSDDGHILFSRIELFYSRMKTESNLLRTTPDGTRMETLYGPERRGFWSGVHGGYGNWTATGERHRQLRLVQPMAYLPNQHLLTTPAGPVVTEGRQGERLLRQRYLRPGGNDPWVITTPWPLDADTLLVAAGKKRHEMVRAEFPRDPVDLGLYLMDVASGELTLLYNDPAAACFEARPLHPRRVPPVLPESPTAHGSGFTGILYSSSVFITREPHVPAHGRLLRVVEGQPQVARHMTHNNSSGEEAWKNHGGVIGRDLATVPLAPDGSFAVEVPADRLLHLQVLDSDRNVVGNQLVWMHVRPGEVKGCIGCHEPTDAAPPAGVHPVTGRPYRSAFQHGPPQRALPEGDRPFQYRAKVWFKGHLPDEREERQRTVQAISEFGR